MGCGSSTEVTTNSSPKTTQVVPKEKYKPFTDFPTPDLLAQAQKDYTKINEDHATDSNGTPLPFPPPTIRAEVFHPEDYKEVDDHARNTPMEISTSSYQKLVAYLIQPARSDIGKVRAFFVWISAHGLHKVVTIIKQVGNRLESDTPLFLLYAILVQRRGGSYTDLLSKMCSCAKIPNKQVTTVTVKGVSYKVGEKSINTSNSHCLVYVEKAWRIIDQHWGSQAVTSQTDYDWVLIAGRRSTPENYHIIYHCDDFYFLTDPEMFIYDHCSPDPADQLLARPVTKSEFIQMARIREPYFSLGLKYLSHLKCVIESDSDKLVITFALPKTVPLDFDYSLYKSKLFTEYNVVRNCNLKRYVLIEMAADCSQIKIMMQLPHFGKFKLEVFGREADGKSSFLEVSQYLILSNNPSAVPPYPDYTKPIGPSHESKNFGISALLDSGAMLEAKNGKIEIAFRVNRKAKYVHELLTEGSKQLQINYVRHYHTETTMTVMIQVPEQGQYIYELYSAETKSLLWSYLITADRGCIDLVPYPTCEESEMAIGDLRVNNEVQYLEPVSHPKPIIEWEAKEELIIKMRIIKESTFIVELIRCSAGANEENFSQYIYLQKTNGELEIFVKFSRVGTYKLNIRIANAVLYQYIITARNIGIDLSPFPTKLDAWKENFKLISPRSLHLPCDQSIHFKLEAEYSESVQVIGKVSSAPLRRVEGTNVWEGDVETGHNTNTLTVISQSQDSQEELLQFQVLTKSEMQNLKNKHNKAVTEAQRYNDELKQRDINENRKAQNLKEENQRNLEKLKKKKVPTATLR